MPDGLMRMKHLRGRCTSNTCRTQFFAQISSLSPRFRGCGLFRGCPPTPMYGSVESPVILDITRKQNMSLNSDWSPRMQDTDYLAVQ